LCRSATDVAIEKYEKTAMQWLKKQNKNKIINDVKEKYKISYAPAGTTIIFVFDICFLEVWL